MNIQLGIIHILIQEFTDIYESSIAEGDASCESNYQELRFNLARVLLELYDEEGKLPFSKYMN